MFLLSLMKRDCLLYLFTRKNPMSSNSTNSMLIIMLFPSTKQFCLLLLLLFQCQFYLYGSSRFHVSLAYILSISNVFFFIWCDYFCFLLALWLFDYLNVYVLFSSCTRINHTHPMKCVFVSLVSQTAQKQSFFRDYR